MNKSIQRNQTWLGLLEKVTKSPKSLVFLKPTKSIPLLSCWLSVSDDSEKLSGPVDLFVSRSLLRVGRLPSKSDLWFLLSAWVFSLWMCLGSFCWDFLPVTTWDVAADFTNTGAPGVSRGSPAEKRETFQQWWKLSGHFSHIYFSSIYMKSLLFKLKVKFNQNKSRGLQIKGRLSEHQNSPMWKFESDLARPCLRMEWSGVASYMLHCRSCWSSWSPWSWWSWWRTACRL